MDLVSFNLPTMLRKTNMKLMLMLLCFIICMVIIYMSSRLSRRPMVNMHGRYDDPSSYERGVIDQSDNIGGDVNNRDREDESDNSVVFAGRLVAGLTDQGTRPMDDSVTSVAIGVAVTAHDDPELTLENVGYRLPFLRTLLPSFCRTASTGVAYRFYVAFDVHDPSLSSQQYMVAVYRRFVEVVATLCTKSVNVSLHFVQCNHNRNPAWAQNDAMMEAYLDHLQYYYRVNDDTEMLSPGWTEVYINALQNNFSPPNVGVVGPLHKGGNEDILTYDFVHRTHIDIFGYYYPRVFTDWWADTWMTKVYGSQRTLKLPGVRLVHTLEVGQRYRVRSSKQKYLNDQLEEDSITLNRYLESVEAAKKVKPASSESLKKVISMSLWGGKPRYTYGALRNAQLLPVYFPDWILRFYIERPRYDDTTKYAPVPPRILGKLSAMGAELVYVDAERSHIPPMMWRFLIADDMAVDVFIVRDSDCRLNDRDSIVVSEWLRTDYAFHCIRDHPSHAGYSLLGGLWGARPRQLRSFVSVPWRDMMMGYRTDYVQDMQFLANAIWPLVQSHAAYCHDSVSCLNWPGSYPFPVARIGTEHLGQVFDAFGNARDEDLQLLLEHRPIPQCSVASNPAAPRKTVAQGNEPQESSSEMVETDREYEANMSETTNDEHVLYSDTADTTVSRHLNNASSNAQSDVLNHNTAQETPAVEQLMLPPVSGHEIRPTSADFQIDFPEKQVQNVPHDHSMVVNNSGNKIFRNTTEEETDHRQLIVPPIRSDETRPTSVDFPIHSSDKLVQNIPRDHSVLVNSSDILSRNTAEETPGVKQLVLPSVGGHKTRPTSDDFQINSPDEQVQNIPYKHRVLVNSSDNLIRNTADEASAHKQFILPRVNTRETRPISADFQTHSSDKQVQNIPNEHSVLVNSSFIINNDGS